MKFTKDEASYDDQNGPYDGMMVYCNNEKIIINIIIFVDGM